MPRRIWEDNITMDLKEMGINTRNWVDSGQDRNYWRALVTAALNLRVPKAMALVYLMTIHVNSSWRTNPTTIVAMSQLT